MDIRIVSKQSFDNPPKTYWTIQEQVSPTTRIYFEWQETFSTKEHAEQFALSYELQEAYRELRAEGVTRTHQIYFRYCRSPQAFDRQALYIIEANRINIQSNKGISFEMEAK